MSRITALATVALLLAASATHALDTSRDDIQAWAKKAAAEQGLDAQDLLSTLKEARSQPSIIKAMSRPAERTKTWAEYRAIFMTAERIEAGRDFWQSHAAEIDKVAAETGVPAEILLGILGVETYFGRHTGKYRVLDSLSTLAFDYPPRSSFFSRELVQFFLLVRDEGIDIDTALGSYAGAMGAPQFMPSSYRAYAADGDGDGRRDLFNSWPDVLASIASYFTAHKWQPGGIVAVPASAMQSIQQRPADNKLSADTTVGALRKLGLEFDSTLDDSTPAGLLAFEGEAGIEHWIALHNFFVITRYNRSSMYGLVVHQLGQAITSQLRADNP